MIFSEEASKHLKGVFTRPGSSKIKCKIIYIKIILKMWLKTKTTVCVKLR